MTSDEDSAFSIRTCRTIETLTDGGLWLVPPGLAPEEPLGLGIRIDLSVLCTERDEASGEQITGALDPGFIEPPSRDPDMKDEVFEQCISLESDGVGELLFLCIECHAGSLWILKSWF